MATLSEYEKIRLENISRNESFLRDIGLPGGPVGKVKKIGRTSKRRAEHVHIEGGRKSNRIRNASVEHQQLSYLDDDDNNGEALFLKERKPTRKSTREVKQYATKKVNTKSTQSSKEVNCNYMIFIGCNSKYKHRRYNDRTGLLTDESCASEEMGEFVEKDGHWVKFKHSGDKRGPISTESTCNDNCGRMLEEVGFGKAAIMAASYFGAAPKFSKYSGIVEWKNCVYLWVNIGGHSGDYNNSFSEQGKYITWFGGSKMHADTPVTHRLLQGGTNETVLLWVRLEKEPYTCLGPLKVVENNVNTYPVTMKWELMLHNQLMAKAKLCHFAEILKENDPPILL